MLAYSTAHTSGGHINCAVTLALTIVGKCHPVRAVCYLVVQLLGSITGAGLLKATTQGQGLAPNLDRTGGLGANGLQKLSQPLFQLAFHHATVIIPACVLAPVSKPQSLSLC